MKNYEQYLKTEWTKEEIADWDFGAEQLSLICTEAYFGNEQPSIFYTDDLGAAESLWDEIDRRNNNTFDSQWNFVFVPGHGRMAWLTLWDRSIIKDVKDLDPPDIQIKFIDSRATIICMAYLIIRLAESLDAIMSFKFKFWQDSLDRIRAIEISLLVVR